MSARCHTIACMFPGNEDGRDAGLVIPASILGHQTATSNYRLWPPQAHSKHTREAWKGGTFLRARDIVDELTFGGGDIVERGALWKEGHSRESDIVERDVVKRGRFEEQEYREGSDIGDRGTIWKDGYWGKRDIVERGAFWRAGHRRVRDIGDRGTS